MNTEDVSNHVLLLDHRITIVHKWIKSGALKGLKAKLVAGTY